MHCKQVGRVRLRYALPYLPRIYKPMAQDTILNTLYKYLPTKHIFTRFLYTVLGMWLLWFVFLSWLACADGCQNYFWGWLLLVCLTFGVTFASLVWAFPAFLECIARLLGRRSPNITWLGSWPQPIGIAVLGWLTSVLSLLIYQLLFQAIGEESPFPHWYFGFMELLIK